MRPLLRWLSPDLLTRQYGLHGVIALLLCFTSIASVYAVVNPVVAKMPSEWLEVTGIDYAADGGKKAVLLDARGHVGCSPQHWSSSLLPKRTFICCWD